jgi:16S rRNA (guanine527-N7)-methyltransferase
MSLEPALARGLRDLALALTDPQMAQLLRYLEQLQKWGAVFNLTAIKDPLAALHVHLLDCLALVASLRRRFGGQTIDVLDVGSGAGLPALVLAICSDPAHLQMQVTSVDAVEKKIAFQRQQKVLLQLNNFEPIHQRVESLQEPSFDLITCRAFASVSDFCSQSRHLLKRTQTAQWVAMKAKPDQDELNALIQLTPPVFVRDTETLNVPGLGAQRQLIWLAQTQAKKE